VTALDAVALCQHLSDRTAQQLRCVDPPEAIEGGFMNQLWKLRLSGGEGAWSGDLVLRRFSPRTEPASVTAEVEIQQWVGAAGFPTPAVVLVEVDASVIGAPFMIMEHVDAIPLMAWLERPGTRMLRVPDVMARCLVRLHELSTVGAPKTRPILDSRTLLDELEAWLERVDDPLVARAVPELAARCPADTAHVICHLDMNPPNILMSDRTIAAVVDWTNSRLADPHLDLADLDVVIRTATVPLSRATAAIEGVGRRWIAHEVLRRYRRRRPLDDRTLRWYGAAAGCRRRLGAVESATVTGPDKAGFTSPEFIDALGRSIETHVASIRER
jgi:aminoglycoside phosphotransferase (APT) family kinase protein